MLEKVVGMERVDATEAILRLDGRKVCNIKRADISQAGRNKATVCALPQSTSFDKGGKCGGAGRGIVQFWKGWCKARDGGEAIPPVVAQFSGDSTSPLTRRQV
ncbi:MAG: hypothetical protein ACLS48_10345 [[Eubacterium] siraeum]